MKCRICSSHNIESFYFKNILFPLRDEKDWKNYYCFDCDSVSHYNSKNFTTNYSDGSYRKKNIDLIKSVDINKALPPIDLPWSTISFMRFENIAFILKKNLKKKIDKFDHYLDYGGYNGLLAYGLQQIFPIKNITIADFDKKGLVFSNYLNFNTIDLAEINISKYQKYDLITLVQVLEHIEEPSDVLLQLKDNLSENGVIYIEVPNLYKTPMSDTSHLSAFSIFGLYNCLIKAGYQIIDIGYTSTLKQALDFNYFYFSKKESLFILASKSKINEISYSILNKKDKLKNINSFKKKILISYSIAGIFEISLNLFKKIVSLFKYFLYFLTISSINLIGNFLYVKFNSSTFFKYILKVFKK